MKLKVKRTLILLTLILTTLLVTRATTHGENDVTYWLIVVNGQSNAGSNGSGTQLTPEQLSMAGELKLYAKQFTDVDTYVPLPHKFTNMKKQFRIPDSGFGTELGFYFGIRDAIPDGDQVRAVRLSKGGTSITAWGPGEPQWNKLVQTVNRARAVWVAEGTGPTNVNQIKVLAFIWNQNEADTEKLSLAKAYGANLRSLISRVRAQWPTGGPIPIPVLFFETHTRLEHPQQTAQVIQAQLDCIATNVDNPQDCAGDVMYTAMVPSRQLSTWDGIHFNTFGQLELGQTMAEEWLAFGVWD